MIAMSLKKPASVALAAAILFAGIAGTASEASAKPKKWGGAGYHKPYKHHYYGHRRPYYRPGFAAAGIGLGALAFTGAAMAASSAYAPACWNERRRVVDEYGDVYVRRVQVCR